MCLGKYAPLKDRIKHRSKTSFLESIMNLLVVSRSIVKGTHQEHGKKNHSCCSVLPLQIFAASATVGRPIHRHLAAFIRWKEHQLQCGNDPSSHSLELHQYSTACKRGTSRMFRQPLYSSPQKRMAAALDRLASYGVLGLPGQHRSDPSIFKVLLPVLRYCYYLF